MESSSIKLSIKLLIEQINVIPFFKTPDRHKFSFPYKTLLKLIDKTEYVKVIQNEFRTNKNNEISASTKLQLKDILLSDFDTLVAVVDNEPSFLQGELIELVKQFQKWNKANSGRDSDTSHDESGKKPTNTTQKNFQKYCDIVQGINVHKDFYEKESTFANLDIIWQQCLRTDLYKLLFLPKKISFLMQFSYFYQPANQNPLTFEQFKKYVSASGFSKIITLSRYYPSASFHILTTEHQYCFVSNGHYFLENCVPRVDRMAPTSKNFPINGDPTENTFIVMSSDHFNDFQFVAFENRVVHPFKSLRFFPYLQISKFVPSFRDSYHAFIKHNYLIPHIKQTDFGFLVKSRHALHLADYARLYEHYQAIMFKDAYRLCKLPNVTFTEISIGDFLKIGNMFDLFRAIIQNESRGYYEPYVCPMIEQRGIDKIGVMDDQVMKQSGAVAVGVAPIQMCIRRIHLATGKFYDDINAYENQQFHTTFKISEEFGTDKFTPKNFALIHATLFPTQNQTSTNHKRIRGDRGTPRSGPRRNWGDQVVHVSSILLSQLAIRCKYTLLADIYHKIRTIYRNGFANSFAAGVFPKGHSKLYIDEQARKDLFEFLKFHQIHTGSLMWENQMGNFGNDIQFESQDEFFGFTNLLGRQLLLDQSVWEKFMHKILREIQNKQVRQVRQYRVPCYVNYGESLAVLHGFDKSNGLWSIWSDDQLKYVSASAFTLNHDLRILPAKIKICDVLKECRIITRGNPNMYKISVDERFHGRDFCGTEGTAIARCSHNFYIITLDEFCCEFVLEYEKDFVWAESLVMSNQQIYKKLQRNKADLNDKWVEEQEYDEDDNKVFIYNPIHMDTPAPEKFGDGPYQQCYFIFDRKENGTSIFEFAKSLKIELKNSEIYQLCDDLVMIAGEDQLNTHSIALLIWFQIAFELEVFKQDQTGFASIITATVPDNLGVSLTFDLFFKLLSEVYAQSNTHRNRQTGGNELDRDKLFALWIKFKEHFDTQKLPPLVIYPPKLTLLKHPSRPSKPNTLIGNSKIYKSPFFLMPKFTDSEHPVYEPVHRTICTLPTLHVVCEIMKMVTIHACARGCRLNDHELYIDIIDYLQTTHLLRQSTDDPCETRTLCINVVDCRNTTDKNLGTNETSKFREYVVMCFSGLEANLRKLARSAIKRLLMRLSSVSDFYQITMGMLTDILIKEIGFDFDKNTARIDLTLKTLHVIFQVLGEERLI